MKLSEKQQRFATMVGKLLAWIDTKPGYAVTMGECWRHKVMVDWYVAQGKGSKRSLHPDKLAIDLLLFINGVYQRDSDAYSPLGMYWESIGGSWGGRFIRRPDGNHFSLAHGGRR
jgi:hypothetical protein